MRGHITSFGGDSLRSYQPKWSLIQVVDLCTRSILITFTFFFFCIQLFRQCVNIVFQHVLVFIIERKIELAGDDCSKPRSHDLHASNIKGAMTETTSYNKRD